jgi:glycosyltransferase involved in cell wall biosynthesis
MKPLVSVVLPVYDGAGTIGRAVQSILAQTYGNFELIVVNDGSADRTPEILGAFDDERVRVLNQENRGLVASLNRGIEASRGKYVARMDADDVALPARFERQVEFMEKNPAVGVVGSAIRRVYPDGSSRIRRRPLDSEGIRRNIVRICPFTHSTVMIRKEVFGKAGLYDAAKDGSRGLLVEDYDLWVRILAAGYELANLPDVLTEYYEEPGSILRSRPLRKRIAQQVFSRVEAIKTLRLGYAAYLNIVPVACLSVLNRYGLKLDRLYNLLSSRR